MVLDMKTMMIGLMLLGFAGGALAIEPAELDSRIRELTAKFEMLQAKADTRIPPDVLQRAQGVILLDRTKAGFLFAYEGGGGVALVREKGTDTWSPAGFLGASEASLGFQVGGEKNFYAILLMSRDADRVLTEPNYKFGGEATGTAGDASGGHEGKFSTMNQPVLIYDSRKGLYGGATIQGGSITPDDKANRIYYGQFVTMRDILLDHRVQTTESSTDLARKLNEYSRVPDVAPSARK
jgi:lipid-binding SYLF domain-containing protein